VSGFGYLWVNVVQTLLRVLPFPCKTGLERIGDPGRDSPVLLTCNFRLTVERVRRALRGCNAWLLVANSRGVNVWCAATGGLLTNHDVVSVVKTSGIEDLVDHRRVILPQLAATGIEGLVVRRKTGWHVVWGPADVADVPEFLLRGQQAGRDIHTVRFPLRQRLEMAVAWAFPISLFALLVLPFWSQGVLPLMGLVWVLSILLFASFPLYEQHLRQDRQRVGFVLFDFGQRGMTLIFWALFLLGLVVYGALTGDLSWTMMLRWGIASLVVVLILSLDLTGSTPVYKSGLHEDRLLRIELDAERCTRAGMCAQVCPVDVFELADDQPVVLLPRAGQCVQCGACIVQCPVDALFFRGPSGDVVSPDTVRRFKLNMLGQRLVEP